MPKIVILLISLLILKEPNEVAKLVNVAHTHTHTHTPIYL